MTLRLPAKMIGDMIAHAYEDLPNECCGLITTDEGVPALLHRMRNADSSPFRYTMDSSDQIRVLREIDYDDSRVLVVYHSHVASRAYPSPTDVLQAYAQGTDFPIFPNAYYVVISLKDRASPLVRAFRIVDRKVRREKLEEVVGPSFATSN